MKFNLYIFQLLLYTFRQFYFFIFSSRVYTYIIHLTRTTLSLTNSLIHVPSINSRLGIYIISKGISLFIQLIINPTIITQWVSKQDHLQSQLIYLGQFAS